MFIPNRLCKHSTIVGVINLHFFLFMVPLAAHKNLKDEFDILKNLDKERQAKSSKMSTRIKQLQNKGKQ